MKIIDQFTTASKLGGRPMLTLAMEALRLRLSGNRLGLTEYIDFQLYKNDLSLAEKRSFGGMRMQQIIEEILVDDYSRFMSLDKVTMYALFEGLKLPIPRMRATYRSLRPATVPELHTAEELALFLAAPGNAPIYFKRSFGGFGRGNTLVSSVANGIVVTGAGHTEAVSEFAGSFDDGKSLGWVLQEPLKSHSSIIELTGAEKISGIRFHTFLSKSGPVPTKAVFKLNVGVKDTDNFEHGASGNMLAAVDIATGRVTRAVRGVGLDQSVDGVHPVTGRSIVGFQIPHWREAVELVTEAQKAFPGFLCPGWDIAVCEDGAKILEVNAFGDIDLSQHAYRKSFADAEFLSLMRGRELDALMTARAEASKKSPRNHRLGVRTHHWQW